MFCRCLSKLFKPFEVEDNYVDKCIQSSYFVINTSNFVSAMMGFLILALDVVAHYSARLERGLRSLIGH